MIIPVESAIVSVIDDSSYLSTFCNDLRKVGINDSKLICAKSVDCLLNDCAYEDLDLVFVNLQVGNDGICSLIRKLDPIPVVLYSDCTNFKFNDLRILMASSVLRTPVNHTELLECMKLHLKIRALTIQQVVLINTLMGFGNDCI